MSKLAQEFSDRPDFYFIARGRHYPVAQEGALKLKELSYIHAEGMPASELKHGTLALIEKGTPVVVIAPSGQGFNDTISNAQELRRGAPRSSGSRRSTPRLQAHGRDPGVQREHRAHPRGHPAPAPRLLHGDGEEERPRPPEEPGQIGHRQVASLKPVRSRAESWHNKTKRAGPVRNEKGEEIPHAP